MLPEDSLKVSMKSYIGYKSKNGDFQGGPSGMDEKPRFWTYSLYKTSGGRMMDLDRPDAKVQCSAEQCSAVQYSAVQCSAV